MTRWLVLLLVARLGGVAAAAALSCPSGTLTPAALTATGPTPHTVTARAAPALAFQAVNTAGTATVQIEMCCLGSCAPATGAWAPVENSSMALTIGTAVKGVLHPTCQYRASVTALSGGSVTVGFACAGP